MKDENIQFLMQAFGFLLMALYASEVLASQLVFWLFVAASFGIMAIYCHESHCDTSLDLWEANLDKCCENEYISDYYLRSV